MRPGTLPPSAGGEALSWPLMLAGLALLYGPTLVDLLRGIWSSEEQAHGPLFLAIAAWLMRRDWPAMARAGKGRTAPGAAWPVLALGLILYAVGRSQDILIFEMGSFICLLAALLLFNGGAAALRVQGFPLFLMLFMLPLPGPLVEYLTLPMKIAVSYATEHILHGFGYPIGRQGVMLQIGQYRLLVADACAGLQTLFTLEALGLLYLNLVRHDSAARNIALGILILPISFAANVTRVTVLTLVTYHFGNEAGQGFLHGFAGLVLFVTALLLIIGVDRALQYGLRARRPGPAPLAGAEA